MEFPLAKNDAKARNTDLWPNPFSDRTRPKLEFKGGKAAKQSFERESNINVIVERARRAGALPPPERKPRYGDFSNVPDFQTALEHVHHTQDLFSQLPARIRQACANDPGEFLRRLSDPALQKLMVEEGLATLKELPPRQPDPNQPSKDDPSSASSTKGRAAPAAKKNSSPEGSPQGGDA